MKLTNKPMRFMVHMPVHFQLPVAAASTSSWGTAAGERETTETKTYQVQLRLEQGNETLGDLYDAISSTFGRSREEHILFEKERNYLKVGAKLYYASQNSPWKAPFVEAFVCAKEDHIWQHSREEEMRGRCHVCFAESSVPLRWKEAKQEGEQIEEPFNGWFT